MYMFAKENEKSNEAFVIYEYVKDKKRFLTTDGKLSGYLVKAQLFATHTFAERFGRNIYNEWEQLNKDGKVGVATVNAMKYTS